MGKRVWTCLVVGAALAGLRGAPPAVAGRYHVYSCRTPAGQGAPADGWAPQPSPSTLSRVATNTCASGGSLTAALTDGAQYEVGTTASWSFAVPPGLTLAGATLWRAGSTEGGLRQTRHTSFDLQVPQKPKHLTIAFTSRNATHSAN